VILNFGIKLCEDGVNDATACGEIKDYIFIKCLEQTVSREGSVE